MVSIVIPTYEMQGQGARLLKQLLDSIQKQTYQDYEIIVSDHALDNSNQNICTNYKKVKYFKNEIGRGSSSINMNNAIRHSSGEYIKPFMQDDLFYKPNSLELMMQKVIGGDWLVCGCTHYNENINDVFNPHPPAINDGLVSLATGTNYYGSPSVILYKRCNEFFDENLIWLMDCEFYSRLQKKFGLPILMNDLLILVRDWQGSVSNTLATQELRKEEEEHVKNKIKL